MLHALAAFGSDVGIEALAAVVADEVDGDEIPDLLWRLTRRSLVLTDPRPGSTRFRLLESVRELLQRRVPHERRAADVARLAAWMSARLGPGATLDRRWAHEMATEIGNLRCLVTELASTDQRAAQHLAWAILLYHARHVDNADRGHNARAGVEEGDRFAEMLGEPSPERVGLLCEAAWLNVIIGDLDRATALLAAADGLCAQVGRPDWKPFTLERVRAEVVAATGDLERAQHIAEAALANASDPVSRGGLLDIAAHLRFELGDARGAASLYGEEVVLWNGLGEEGKAAAANASLAESLLTAGDITGAAKAQRACIDAAFHLGAHLEVVYSIHLTARIAALRMRWNEAGALAAIADDQLARLGVSMYPSDRARADLVVAECREALGEQRHADLVARSIHRDLSEVIAEVCAFLDEQEQIPSNGPTDTGVRP